MRAISTSAQAVNSGPAVVDRIGPISPIFNAHCRNGLRCPAPVPTVACTSSCARTSRMRAPSVSTGETNSSAWRSLDADVAQHSPTAPHVVARFGQPIAKRISAGML
jgi:hypothetical protein